MAQDTASEQYRHECEVRHVAAMPSRDERKHYLAGVRRHRGNDAAQRIKDDLFKLYARTSSE